MIDDPRSKLLLDEALRQIADAATDLASLRTRASGLIAAIGVGTAFFGANLVRSAHGLTAASWAAITLFGVAMMLGAFLVAVPVPGWIGGFDPTTVTSWITDRSADIDSIRLELADQLAAGARHNRGTLAVRQALLGAQALLFVAEIVVWLVDLS